ATADLCLSKFPRSYLVQSPHTTNRKKRRLAFPSLLRLSKNRQTQPRNRATQFESSCRFVSRLFTFYPNRNLPFRKFRRSSCSRHNLHRCRQVPQSCLHQL